MKTKWLECGTSAISQEAEVANAHETFAEQVQQKSAQEFIERKSQ
jgi:hypothetical protein